MKSFSVSFVYPVAAALSLVFVGGGCTHDYSYSPPPQRRSIPLAPVGATSPGIGGPGGGSSDTRATGTVAAGQGDRPLGVTNAATAPVVAPGVAPVPGTVGVNGGR